MRVINDGVRDLSSTATDIGYPSHWVHITPDGDVWLSGASLTFRLGDEATFQGPDDIGWSYPDVGPDGSLWAIAASEYIQSFDGQKAWTKRSRTDGRRPPARVAGHRPRRHRLGGGE